MIEEGLGLEGDGLLLEELQPVEVGLHGGHSFWRRGVWVEGSVVAKVGESLRSEGLWLVSE